MYKTTSLLKHKHNKTTLHNNLLKLKHWHDIILQSFFSFRKIIKHLFKLCWQRGQGEVMTITQSWPTCISHMLRGVVSVSPPSPLFYSAVLGIDSVSRGPGPVDTAGSTTPTCLRYTNLETISTQWPKLHNIISIIIIYNSVLKYIRVYDIQIINSLYSKLIFHINIRFKPK